MELQTHIAPELWQSISTTYEAKNYSGAILDAMHHLSSVLRDKTGADGDGASLVGQALGGDSPRLRVNKLKTETERNIQKGLEQILRGLYLAVRNPRSHEQIEDTQETADAVIYFIDYVLGILSQSKQPFTLPKFLSRVFDPDFVATERYAELLVDEVPTGKLLNVLVEIYRRKGKGDRSKLGLTVSEILKRLPDEQVIQFLDVVAKEFKTTQDENVILSALQVLPPGIWPKIPEIARLRVEGKLLLTIKEGRTHGDLTNAEGEIGTWASDFLPHFTHKREVVEVLVDKLNGDEDGRRYILRFFATVLPEVTAHPLLWRGFVRAISNAIKEGDSYARSRLLEVIRDYPAEWQKAFAKSLKDEMDLESPAPNVFRGIPFLKADK